MLKLPIDKSTFSDLRKLDYLYVDKTQHMYTMITQGHRYFLSRPRRFGKSLLISTLEEILRGNKELFSGLWINNSDYQWQEHGVIVLDFSLLSCDTPELFIYELQQELAMIAKRYTINIDLHETPALMLKKIVHALYEQYDRVAILIDEYDSPILKTLDNQELAEQIRNTIQQFFTTIKGLDKYVQFAFITGVSSFVKAGLFSGINNLRIITLQDKFATICGYTDQEIDHYFKEHMMSWSENKKIPYDQLRQNIKNWYNGYSFGHNVPKVYNPFSLMNALDEQEFKNFWFQSGAPTFLIKILKKEYKNFDPNDLEASADFLGYFDIDALYILPLMFQAGYLTITDRNPDTNDFILDYPNTEVQISFQKYFLEIFAKLDATLAEKISRNLFKTFNKNSTVTYVTDKI